MRITRPLQNMTIPRRVKAGYVFLTLLVLVLGCIGIATMVWINSWSSDFNAALPQAQAAAAVSEASANMVVYGAAVVIAGNGETAASFKAMRDENKAEVMEALDSLAALEEGAEGAAAVEGMRASFELVYESLMEATESAEEDLEDALFNISGMVMPSAARLDEAATSYLEDKQAEESEALSGLQSTAGSMLLWLAIVVGLAVVFAVVLAWRVSREITSQLKAAVASISSSSAEMMAISTQVAAGAAQTAASTNETTATVEEVKQTAQLAHEKAKQVAENSENLAQYSEGQRVGMEFTLSGFVEMQNQMAVVAETINRLSDQTQAVGEIIATVNDLAEQSNLLSVNASIEAAKAGEQGKGFTVVAQEVKNLAEQSKQAVTQVRTILSEIQKAGQAAVQAAEKGREVIDTNRQHLEEAREDAQVLVESVNETAQSAVQISASSRQQLAGMEQIGTAMESINQASSQSVSETRQVEQEIKNLQELALRLKRLVDTKAEA
jgi:hypothetical protein